MSHNNSESLKILSTLFEETTGEPTLSITPLTKSGGDRDYWRLQAQEDSAIGCKADSIAESRAFVNLAKAFSKYGVSVPRILAHSSDFHYYLQQDLGDISLFDRINEAKKSPEVVSDWEKSVENACLHTLRQLARMQTVPLETWQPLAAYPPMDRRQILWDLNYFKYEFLKPAGISFDEGGLEDDFEKIVSALLSIPRSQWGFMMRDCQSRNVMLNPGPVFIDFQGGRYGPLLYDAVSFLWQAKAGFSDNFRFRMLGRYAAELEAFTGVPEEEILVYFPVILLFRTLQVLGAYGFRGLVQKRAHFVESIPGALANLESLCHSGALDQYPVLKSVAEGLAVMDKFKDEKPDGLEVKVFSFSYKRGYPDDFSGNGGGFMFDCRSLHNPGRYDEYKALTGLDAPVRDFLHRSGDADIFVARAFDMVAPAVGKYLEREFTSLHVGFGCTGGRHRSVYCAEALGNFLAQRFPDAKIRVIHREQGIDKYL